MPLSIPSGVINYNGPMQAFPSRFRATVQTVDKDYAMPMSVAWAATPAARAVLVNIGAQNTQISFGVLQALYINNVNCGVDVDFYEPATDFRLTIPAGGEGLFPYVSISSTFYVIAAGAGSQDRTDFTAFNYLPPPISIQKPSFLNVASVSGIAMTDGSTAILAGPSGGTLQELLVVFSGGVAGAGNSVASITVQDGNGAAIARAVIAGGGAANVAGFIVIALPGINVRFGNGLAVVVANSGAAPFALGELSVNAYYH